METHSRFLDGRIVCVIGDITDFRGSGSGATAIVNAANRSLLGGGGVDGAIHRAGGSPLLEECQALRRSTLPDGLQTGAAVMTGAGHLPVAHVIHTVGPVWAGGDAGEPELLRSAYAESLRIAAAADLVELAFPAVSTGVFGYPPPLAAAKAAAAIGTHLAANGRPESVYLVFFQRQDADTFAQSCGLTPLE